MSVAKQGGLCLFLSPVNVSFVLYDYFPFGGLQEDCLLTARAMQARGHTVEVVTRTWKGEMPNDLAIHLMGRQGCTNTARNTHFFAQLKQYFSVNARDAVVAFNRIPECDFYFSADPCYLEKVKDKPFWYFWTARHRHYRDCEAALFTDPVKPQIYTLTEREIDTYCRYYQTPRERFHLLPPGVNRVTRTLEEKKQIRAALRQELGTSEEATVALFVGSDYKRKGLMRNLEAVKALAVQGTRLELWVLGADDPKSYEAFARASNLPVQFLGGRADAARFFDAADMLLHPAHSESAGKVLLESLTHGLPVVVTDTCGYAKQIGDSAGGVVVTTPFSQEVYNQTVERLVVDQAHRSMLSAAALSYCATEDIYSCSESFTQAIISNIQAD
ncbi:glycosyltransferase family 4 protein [Coraliomargarita sp. W4R53]